MKFTKTWMTGTNRRVMLFLAYSVLFYIGLMGIADVVLNFYFVSLGYDIQTIGLLQSLPRLSGFLTSIPLGLLANRIGTHRMILYGTLGFAASFVLAVFFPSLAMLTLSRFLGGFFYGAQQIGFSPFMIALVEKNFRIRFFAYQNVVSMIATSAGNSIGGRLPAVIVMLFAGSVPAAYVANARTPFAYGVTILIAAVITALSAVPFMLIPAERVPTSAIQPVRIPGEKMKRYRVPWTFLTLLNFPLLIFGFTGGLTYPFYNLFFRTTYNLPDATVGNIYSLGFMVMAFIPLLNPWLERHFGRVWALGITMVIASVAFTGLGFATVVAVAVVFFVVAASFRNMFQPLFQPLMMDYLPVELHNVTTSMGMVLWNIGWMTATLISGTLQTTIGYGGIMQIVAIGVLLVGISIVAIFRHRVTYQPERA